MSQFITGTEKKKKDSQSTEIFSHAFNVALLAFSPRQVPSIFLLFTVKLVVRLRATLQYCQSMLVF